MRSQFILFKTQRFLPLFIAQFLGAVNDYLLKTALVIMLAYGLVDSAGIDPEILVSLSAALFILPFILFCGLAGTYADKYDKADVIRVLKLAEIGIVLLAIMSLYSGSWIFGFLCLFALGTQSAFFAPCKYAIVPQHVQHSELIGANGLLSTGTYLAILIGTILGSVITPLPNGVFVVCILLFVFSIIGYLSSLKIPSAPASDLDTGWNWNIFKKNYEIFVAAKRLPLGIFTSIMAVSWFHLMAATFHTQLPNFSRFTLGADANVLALFMIVFSLGIALGGLLNNKILKSRVNCRLVPWAGFAIFFLYRFILCKCTIFTCK